MKNDDRSVLQLNATPAAMFQAGSIQTVTSVDKMSVKVESLNLETAKGLLKLNFDAIYNGEKENIDLVVSLYPSQSSYFENKALVGIAEYVELTYELVSFRIEQNSSSISLLKPNLYLEGQTVLTVGLLNQNTDDIVYFQQSVPALNFNKLLTEAMDRFAKSDMTIEELIQLESDYFRLKVDRTLSATLNNSYSEEVMITGTIDAHEDVKANHQEEIRSYSLVSRVSDSIFKSGTFNQWNHYNNTSDASPYAYSYITYRFAGTDNRLTYLVFMDIPVDNNFASQEYSLQLTVRDNLSVLYNVYTGDLGFFGDNNRIRVNNITLKHKSNTSKGVFNG